MNTGVQCNVNTSIIIIKYSFILVQINLMNSFFALHVNIYLPAVLFIIKFI